MPRVSRNPVIKRDTTRGMGTGRECARICAGCYAAGWHWWRMGTALKNRISSALARYGLPKQFKGDLFGSGPAATKCREESIAAFARAFPIRHGAGMETAASSRRGRGSLDRGDGRFDWQAGLGAAAANDAGSRRDSGPDHLSGDRTSGPFSDAGASGGLCRLGPAGQLQWRAYTHRTDAPGMQSISEVGFCGSGRGDRRSSGNDGGTACGSAISTGEE